MPQFAKPSISILNANIIFSILSVFVIFSYLNAAKVSNVHDNTNVLIRCPDSVCHSFKVYMQPFGKSTLTVTLSFFLNFRR